MNLETEITGCEKMKKGIGIVVEDEIKFESRILIKHWKRHNGNKVVTTRLNLKCLPGAIVKISGYDFILSSVHCVPVLDACRSYWDDEGFKDAVEMATELFTLYDGLRCGELVYVHEFRRLRMLDGVN